MHMLSLVIMMLSCGILGGLINSYLDKNNPDKSSNSTWEYMVIGIGASLTVPLFLNTISSSLFIDSKNEPYNILVIMGFCLIAAMSSKSFIKTVSDRAIKTANQANKTANKAEASAALSEKRANSLIMPIVMIELEKYEQAVIELNDKVLKDDKEFSDAWAWKGFAQRRFGQLNEAVYSLEQAVKYERVPELTWHYNLACYKALTGKDISEFTSDLDIIYNSTDPRRNDLLKCLRSDEDFASIKDSEVFKKYLK